jgi:hypothetical protein
MALDNLHVARGEFSMEDPWAIPPACEIVRLRRATDGDAPRLSTALSAYYDHDYLSVVFSGADDLVVSTLLGHDEPLYNEDVVEVFLAPNGRAEYFEIEVSPAGAAFDARIESPDGSRATMKSDVAWNCDGLVTAVRKLHEAGGAMTVDTVIRIPFRALDRSAPAAGESWYANFFRIDRHPAEGDEYSAWRPTLRQPPDFHVPSAFGRLSFR